MSTQITTAMVEQYRSNVYHVAQQKGSKLANAVRREVVNGKSHYFERIGATAAVKRTSRHADTPLVNTPHSRRRVQMDDWEWADLIDKQDEIRLLIDPASAYAMAGGNAMGRAWDDTILEAIRGTAYSGEAGGTSVALPAAQRATEAGTTAITDGLTFEKLVQARTTIGKADVDLDEEALHIACTYEQISDMLQQDKFINSDYAAIKALQSGDPTARGAMGSPGYMGFVWHITNRVPLKSGSSNLRDVMVWAPSGIGLAVGQEMQTRITERDDKSYATQVYLSSTCGATRIEEEKVFVLECYEA